MDVSSEKYETDNNQRRGGFSTLPKIFKNIFKRLTGLFTLTEKEKSEAGIYYGGERRD